MKQVVSGKRVNPSAKMLTFLPPGVLLGISGGGVPLGCPNPDPIRPTKCHFSHSFSDMTSMKLRHQGQKPKKIS